MSGKRIFGLILLGILGLFVLIQLVPYGRDHTNPPVTAEPTWDSPRTLELATGACFDCHSNETQWPWYTNVAPMSWLVQRDVDVGRDILNFSEWDRPQAEAGDILEVTGGGGMPPLQYKILHSSGRLSDAERQELVAGFQATFAVTPPIPGGGGG